MDEICLDAFNCAKYILPAKYVICYVFYVMDVYQIYSACEICDLLCDRGPTLYTGGFYICECEIRQ
jgi:hypothetical protein